MASSDSKFDEFMSGKGYETGPSRMGSESISSVELGQKKKTRHHTDKQKHTIAIKRKKVMTDSGYEQDVSSRGIPMNDKVDKEEELTQFLPMVVGSGYVDHSLDPDLDSDLRPFAPIHRKPTFPESLFAMLSNPELSSIITWLPHGRSFIIVDRESLHKDVLPLYFRHNNLSSFTRQLNGYRFVKIKIGPFERSYYHPFLLKNLPHLVKYITRENTKEKSASSVTEAQLENVSNERPLPLRMKTVYAQHINDMNVMVNERRKAAKAKEEAILREQSSQAPIAASAVPAFSHENGLQASFHPIPSVIYTPSPNQPLPQVVRTSPQQQPNVEGYGDTQQGTFFHLPLTSGVIQNQAQANLSSLHQQFLQPLDGAASQLKDLAAQVQAQAQIQLLANAIAAAQQGPSFQLQLPQYGLAQSNIVYQQPQQFNASYPAHTFPQVTSLTQQDPTNHLVQQGVGIVSGPNSLGSIPTLQDIVNAYAMQQQQQQQQQQQHYNTSANSQFKSPEDNGQQTHEM